MKFATEIEPMAQLHFKISILTRQIFITLAAMLFLSSCVAKRYLTQSQQHVAQLQSDSTTLQDKVYSFQNQVTKMETNIASLNKKIDDLNNTIADLNSQNKQLGQKTAEQQNLLLQSRKDLDSKQQRLQQLEELLAQQREMSVNLKNKMIDALQGYNSNELSVYQKNGKVYISLSENLLFPSGSAAVNQEGTEALSKLAVVLNQNPDVNIQIEGNTDSIPIKGRYQDNWDLSTARANSIVRILVDKYNVNPKSVVSVGHSYYDPVAENDTPEGRAKNRRTDIVLSPNLEAIYNLLDNY